MALEPPCEPITGDSHEHLLRPLEEFANTQGFAVSYRPLSDGGADGWCNTADRLIVVNSEAPANARVQILVHEIAHALGVDYQAYSRQEAEVIVDTVAAVVCAGAGLDTLGETLPYLAGWGGDNTVERIRDAAATIDKLARTIEQAIDRDVRNGTENEGSG